MNFIVVIALYLTFAASYFTYFHVCTKQILSVIPKNLSQPVFFLLKELFFGLAFTFFSLLLLIYTYDISLESTLNSGVLVVILVALIWQVSRLKKLYGEELKGNLFKDDEYLKLRSIDLLAEKSSKEKGEIYLRRLLGVANLPYKIKSRVMTSLGIIGNHQTIVDLVNVLQQDENPRNKSAALSAINTIIEKGKRLNKFPVTKHLLLKTYEDLLLSRVPMHLKFEVIKSLKYFDLEDVIGFLEDHLESDNAEIKANIIETLGSFKDRGIIPYIQPYLENEDMRIVRAAVISLWQFEQMRILLIPKIAGFMVAENIEDIERALIVIETINATWEREYVVRKLKHERSHIRLNALITLIKLGETAKIDELLKKMLALSKQKKREEMEFALSRYRNFSDKTKRLMVRKIQQMKEEDAERFYNVFYSSKFAFEMEESALS